MQTQDMQAEQEQRQDPAQVALDAINAWDLYVRDRVPDMGAPMEAEELRLMARAHLRTWFAGVSEGRRHTNLLTSMLAKLQAIEYNTRGQP